jgi:hypothetical protein
MNDTKKLTTKSRETIPLSQFEYGINKKKKWGQGINKRRSPQNVLTDQ